MQHEARVERDENHDERSSSAAFYGKRSSKKETLKIENLEDLVTTADKKVTGREIAHIHQTRGRRSTLQETSIRNPQEESSTKIVSATSVGREATKRTSADSRSNWRRRRGTHLLQRLLPMIRA
jgi:hypothetical protein